jgi:Zn finger protein HypA/HybF involved in hydrogenase expression
VHELSLVEELVAQCRAAAGGRRALVVWARCPAATDAEEVDECFGYLAEQLAAAGDPSLQGAVLRLETVASHIRCGCGYEGDLDDGQVAGHMGVCPSCGRAGELDQPPLELMGMSFAPSAVAQGTARADELP